MLVCQNHVRKALQILVLPHIKEVSQKAPCCFCQKDARLNVYYSHQSIGYEIKKIHRKPAS
ncbi:hypothetical protein ABE41_017580 [Fictibacillus arsenicus]|uniref:CxxH/CxxC protein n=1 Tax=Fictibacillus arsenicus TaxID=255247 RepID=A0A1B1Z8R7_9BACL|nr:hypothetical protein [Fictibacillus arsenicus]ANX13825.1 hypothetical protein ABE41_017580 [Fictibacillus arsenicus]